MDGDPLAGDDFHLALYLCYEVHYAEVGAGGGDWEWEPALIGFRRRLEDAFEKGLTVAVPHGTSGGTLPERLIALARADDGRSLSKYVEASPSLDKMRELVIQRSGYHLKEADPHTWAIPRLTGAAKAALVEIQADEYGGGDPAAMHSVLFAQTMRELGLDDSYGAYLSKLPGIALANVNLMSMFGLHRRWRGAAAGHLALFEMTSTEPNRRYGNALRALGFGPEATAFYDEHVEADAVHENIAAYDLAGSIERDEPEIASDVELGAHCLAYLERQWGEHLMSAWDAGRSSLL